MKGDSTNEKNVVYLLRQDLRLHDNRALLGAIKEASQRGGKVACAFIWSEREEGTAATWGPGAASRVWLHHALHSLDSELRTKHGSGIIFAAGDRHDTLLDLSRKLGAESVHWSKRYEPAQIAADIELEAKLREAGLMCTTWQGYLLREPSRIAYDMSRFVGHFGTLTPFSAACDRLGALDRTPAAPPSATLRALVMAPPKEVGVPLDDLGLVRLPKDKDGNVIDWAAQIRGTWGFGEADALSLLDLFTESAFAKYEAQRHFADGRAVSRLSAYLHAGQLSPRLVQEKIEAAGGKKVSKTFARRLVWRDLAYWQLHQWPGLPYEGIRPQVAARRWVEGAEKAARLRAWQRGQTGFPLVDAGMRELWATGWMQQSVRMAASSFLVDVLQVNWVEGAKWFHDTLVDADLAINSMMWQNCGGSGMDPWNFILDPASSYQDPTGEYVAKWVPELARLKKPFIHQPWTAPEATLAAAGVVLGTTYPHRIVADVAAARAQSDAWVREARAAAPADLRDAGGYDIVRFPAGAVCAPQPLKNGGAIRVFTLPKHRMRGGSAEDISAPADAEAGEEAGADGGAHAQKKSAASVAKAKRAASASRQAKRTAAGGASASAGAAKASGKKASPAGSAGSAGKAAAAAAAAKKKRGRATLADSPIVRNAENDRAQSELKAYRGANWEDVEALEDMWQEEQNMRENRAAEIRMQQAEQLLQQQQQQQRR